MPQGRKTAIRLTLTPAERDTLSAMQHSVTITAGLARRARLVLLVADGTSISHVARTVGIGKNKVYRWVARYQAQGLAGLEDTRGHNRPVMAGRDGGGRRKTFQFAQGQTVWWAEAPDYEWVVVWKRITYRDLCGPVVEYALQRVGHDQAPLVWTREADLVAWEDKP